MMYAWPSGGDRTDYSKRIEATEALSGTKAHCPLCDCEVWCGLANGIWQWLHPFNPHCNGKTYRKAAGGR